MKRFVIVIVALVISIAASAQSHFGVIGGLNFSNAPKASEFADGSAFKMATLYHAGLTYQYKFTLGFSVQPSILYQVKGTNLLAEDGSTVQEKLRDGSIEIPVALQWGPDLLLFRPYVEAVPYIGFNVMHEGNFSPEKFQGGVGLGGGIEIWKLQISARYNWDFTPHAQNVDGAEQNWAYRYTTLSLAFIF